MSFIEKIQNRFFLDEDCDTEYCLVEDHHRNYSVRLIAFLVGAIAFLMPAAPLIARAFDFCHYFSISHTNYAPVLGTIFIGGLCGIFLLLLAYQGESKAERRFASIVGLFALGVAFFPTGQNGCTANSFITQMYMQAEKVTTSSVASSAVEGGLSESLYRLRPNTIEGASSSKIGVTTDPKASLTMDILNLQSFEPGFALISSSSTYHASFAGLLFISLAIFCFVVFPTKNKDDYQNSVLKPSKIRRNFAYRVCGTLITLAIVMLIAGFAFGWVSQPWWNGATLTFYFELIALWAFGVAWITRSKAVGFLGRKGLWGVFSKF